jgi:hypothetical protein
VLVYRLDDRLFFANAGYVTGRVREALHGAPTPVRRALREAGVLGLVGERHDDPTVRAAVTAAPAGDA